MVGNILLGVLITLFVLESIGYVLIGKFIGALVKYGKEHPEKLSANKDPEPEEAEEGSEKTFPTLVFRSMSEAEDAVEACQEILDENGFLTVHQYYEHGKHVLRTSDVITLAKEDLDAYGWMACGGAAIFNIVVHKPGYGDRIEGLPFDGDIYEVRYVDEPKLLKEA